MLNEHLTRQSNLIPNEVLGEPITIIGAGAIGSWTTLALAKMGFCNLTVYDHDQVDIVNMNSQFYRFKDIGKLKVVALHDMVLDFTGTRIQFKEFKYTHEICPGIVIAAVDSMEVRRTIWENHEGKSLGTRAIIDPRMGAEQALLYVMNPMNEEDAKSYKASLYSDSEAVQERCTSRAVIYTANMLSGLVCKAVKDLLTRPDYVRSVSWNIKEDAFQAFRKKPTND